MSTTAAHVPTPDPEDRLVCWCRLPMWATSNARHQPDLEALAAGQAAHRARVGDRDTDADTFEQLAMAAA